MSINIDLRKEFDDLMDEYGYPILLHRTGRKIRCRCWNEKYQEAKTKCPICVGTGWVSRIERHTLRDTSAVQTIARTGLGEQTGLGKMWVDAKTFYMRHNSNPKVGDYLYEVGWTSSQKPSHLSHVYRINDIIANRGDNGRIEYWTVSAKSETVNMEWQNIVVRSIGPIQNYEMIYK
jgi:hypothetical protein